MNKDVADTTATDAAAPAIAAPAERSPDLARTLDAMEEPGTLADVVEITEHYETDAELAEFAVERLNSAIATGAKVAQFYSTCDSLAASMSFETLEASHRAQAHVATHVLISRALMRSAAAHERMASGAEHSRRREEERRAVADEINRLHLENLKLQNRAFRGHVDRLDALAQYAVSFAQEIAAGRLEGNSDPRAEIAAFAKHLLQLAGEEMFLATADGTASQATGEKAAG